MQIVRSLSTGPTHWGSRDLYGRPGGKITDRQMEEYFRDWGKPRAQLDPPL